MGICLKITAITVQNLALKPCVHTTTEMCTHIQIFTTVRIDFPVL